jgi:hypothetical protein
MSDGNLNPSWGQRPVVQMPEDIVDALEAEGTPLAFRAARYIRIKRQTEAGLEQQLRSICRKSLERESQVQHTESKAP